MRRRLQKHQPSHFHATHVVPRVSRAPQECTGGTRAQHLRRRKLHKMWKHAAKDGADKGHTAARVAAYT